MFEPAETEVSTPEPAPTPTRNSRPKLRSPHRWWRDVIEIVLIVIIIYTFVNLMTARAIIIGSSMAPNFATDQLVIVNRFVYYFAQPSRGDVVVISNPTQQCKDVVKNTIDLPFFSVQNNPNDEQCADFIKRIIGLPGESLEIKKGRVYVNGVMLDEPYIAKFCEIGCDKTWTIGPNEYFVLGDNRSNSYDSHSFGPINQTLIVGQAWIRYWPLDVAGIIPHPQYGPIPSAAPSATATPQS